MTSLRVVSLKFAWEIWSGTAKPGCYTPNGIVSRIIRWSTLTPTGTPKASPVVLVKSQNVIRGCLIPHPAEHEGMEIDDLDKNGSPNSEKMFTTAAMPVCLPITREMVEASSP